MGSGIGLDSVGSGTDLDMEDSGDDLAMEVTVAMDVASALALHASAIRLVMATAIADACCPRCYLD